MNISQFLLAHNTTSVNANINYPYRININYDEYEVSPSQIVGGKLQAGAIDVQGNLIGGVDVQGKAPNPGGVGGPVQLGPILSGPPEIQDPIPVKIVTGLTVTVTTKKDWGTTSNDILDLEQVLLTADTVRYTLNGETRKLLIIDRSRYTSVSGDKTKDYYYFKITPILVTQTGEDPGTGENLPQLLNITFTPYLQDEKYQYNNYNPLISNILDNRISTVIQQSDRLKSDIRPTNLSDILSGSAEPAQIQDSNYTATGWSNARYTGCVSDAVDQGGVPSVVVGRLFLGEINSNATQESLICSRSEADRLYKQLIFTGNEELPTYRGYVSSSYRIQGNVASSSAVLPYSSIAGNSSGSIEIGSILQVGASDERIRVERIELANSRFRVTRGYLQTTPADIVGSTIIKVLEPLRILTTEETSAKFSNSVNNKIYVKETQEILFTDGYGMVYTSSSQCIL